MTNSQIISQKILELIKLYPLYIPNSMKSLDESLNNELKDIKFYTKECSLYKMKRAVMIADLGLEKGALSLLNNDSNLVKDRNVKSPSDVVGSIKDRPIKVGFLSFTPNGISTASMMDVIMSGADILTTTPLSGCTFLYNRRVMAHLNYVNCYGKYDQTEIDKEIIRLDLNYSMQGKITARDYKGLNKKHEGISNIFGLRDRNNKFIFYSQKLKPNKLGVIELRERPIVEKLKM